MNTSNKLYRVSLKTLRLLRAFLSCAIAACALVACAVSTHKEVRMGTNHAAQIAHVTRRHSIRQMQKAQGANVGMSLGCILTRICGSGLATTAMDAVAGTQEIVASGETRGEWPG